MSHISPGGAGRGTERRARQRSALVRCIGCVLLALTLGSSGAALATTDAAKCESSKLKAAGTYGTCRMKADAKAVARATVPDYSRCNSKQMSTWAKFDERYAGACPTAGDQSTVATAVADFTMCLAQDLHGSASSCDLVTLHDDLTACESALTACEAAQPAAPAQPLATGQIGSHAVGDDGALQQGVPRSYTDNGDGTVTDTATGLMWEKKVKLDATPDAANLHDADNVYRWGGNCTGENACNNSGTCCRTDSDCAAGHACVVVDGQGTGLTIFSWVMQLNAASFAGHTDWRVPNVNELLSIVDYNVLYPSVSVAFSGTSCGASCPDITNPSCSCTAPALYWSSTALAPGPNSAWYVAFDYGNSGFPNFRDPNYRVRAVRTAE
jgi:hypothetical protein